MKLTHGYYHLIAILTVAIWGLTFIATKVLINHGLTPQEIFFYRFLIAYIGIWAISPKHLFADNLKDELWLVAGGVFGGSLYFFTENTALGITQASNVAFIICTAPLLTTILSLLFYKSEKATKGLVYGSLLALIGVGLVVFNGSVVLKLSPVGDLLTLLAALSWAFYSLVIKRMTGRYPTVFITRKIFFYGVLTILPAFLLHPLQPDFDATARIVQSLVPGSPGFFDLLYSLECGFETAGNDAGFQLYLFESVGDDGGFGAHSPRTNHMDYVNGGGLHHIRGLSGGKEVGSFHLLSAGKLRTNIDIVYPRTSGFVSALS